MKRIVFECRFLPVLGKYCALSNNPNQSLWVKKKLLVRTSGFVDDEVSLLFVSTKRHSYNTRANTTECHKEASDNWWASPSSMYCYNCELLLVDGSVFYLKYCEMPMCQLNQNTEKYFESTVLFVNAGFWRMCILVCWCGHYYSVWCQNDFLMCQCLNRAIPTME